MAQHYPPHTQTQGYQTYTAAPPTPYTYNAGYYPAFPPRGAAAYTFDSTAPGATLMRSEGGPPIAPEVPGISSQLASHALQRLIASEMRDAGFESAEAGAVRRLELEVASCTSPQSMDVLGCGGMY